MSKDSAQEPINDNQPGYYVLFVWRDIEPQLKGPFDTCEERNMRARELREQDPDLQNGIFILDIAQSGYPEVGTLNYNTLEEE